MDARAWRLAKQLLADVVDLPLAEQRVYIERHCADPVLRAELLAMLDTPAPVSNVIAGAITIPAGTRLGRYEISAALGAGGMGEVYRARDTQLGRDVAVKVLPLRTSSDPVAAARFAREAHAIAALNHPHICAIHDVGEEHGRPYLVMELLDGESLDQRLARGRCEAVALLDYAIALADALDAAHAAGVIHRDLKPSNVIITARGAAKILDFGLAKHAPTSVLTQTRAATLTEAGSGVGTLAYMSPEQMRGEEVDARSDLFSLGAVLYEMATGRAAFDGPATVVAEAILTEQPALVTDVVPGQPASLAFVIDKLLEKDRGLRYQDARALRADLSRIRNELASTPDGAPKRRRVALSASARSARINWILAAVTVLFLPAGFALGVLYDAPGVGRETRFIVPKHSDQPAGSFALSPDGRYLVYTDRIGTGPPELHLRALETTDSRRLPDTEHAEYPFWSPDSRTIGFFARGLLRKTGVAGGPPQTVCEVNNALGGTWNQRGVILFGATGGLYQVSDSAGGTPTLALDDRALVQRMRWPQFLPDGQRFLYFESGGGDRSIPRGIRVGSLDTSRTQPLMVTEYMGRYAAPGHLLYVEEGNLVARRFDVTTLVITGEPAIVVQGVGVDSSANFRSASFSVSNDGSVVFGVETDSVRLQWLDRTGRPAGFVGEPDLYWSQELSPDGTRVALEVLDAIGQGDIWMYDLLRGSYEALTRTPAFEYSPRWSRDGRAIAYSSNALEYSLRSPRDGSVSYSNNETTQERVSIRLRRADAWGSEVVIGEEAPGVRYVTDWWPGDRAILIRVPSLVEGKARPYGTLTGLSVQKGTLAAPAPLPAGRLVADARLSPDGRWLAYVSNETGKDQVYVERVEGGSRRRHTASTTGGEFPVWRNDGAELFYVAAGGLLVTVPVSGNSELRLGTPQNLFPLPSLRADFIGRSVGRRSPYTTRDGQRFLVRTRIRDTSTPLTWVQNWTAGLPQK